MSRVVVVHPNDEVEISDLADFRTMKEAAGIDTAEVVYFHGGSALVDEDGLAKRLPINWKASDAFNQLVGGRADSVLVGPVVFLMGDVDEHRDIDTETLQTILGASGTPNG